MTIGDRLRIAREKKDITQVDAAKQIGISDKTLSKYETDQVKQIPSTKIEKLAVLYDVTPGFLMGWGEEEEKNKKNSSEIIDQKSFERDPEVIALMEEMHKNPNLRILMSTSKNVTKESLEMLIKLAQQMKENDD